MNSVIKNILKTMEMQTGIKYSERYMAIQEKKRRKVFHRSRRQSNYYYGELLKSSLKPKYDVIANPPPVSEDNC